MTGRFVARGRLWRWADPASRPPSARSSRYSWRVAGSGSAASSCCSSVRRRSNSTSASARRPAPASACIIARCAGSCSGLAATTGVSRATAVDGSRSTKASSTSLMTSVVRHSPMRCGMSLRPRLEGILGEHVSGPAPERGGQRRPVPRRVGLLYGSLELLEVGDHVTIRSEHHEIVTHRQRGSPVHADCRQGPAGRVHGLVQVVPCGVGVEVRPELVGELVPVQPMRRLQRQQLDQRPGLAQPPGAVGDRSVTLGDLETA